ncbi:hypothetical protein NUW54_g5711 [Trametes sanguinea]|uniref:Uncharacterized protein n=1 Tax=Trametes sanguinea TaxID=158606 RepID=A0ACC1PW73_9APHY|nr:hypothetical protein NUW54_g5711 [Trametes sanguinea]
MITALQSLGSLYTPSRTSSYASPASTTLAQRRRRDAGAPPSRICHSSMFIECTQVQQPHRGPETPCVPRSRRTARPRPFIDGDANNANGLRTRPTAGIISSGGLGSCEDFLGEIDAASGVRLRARFATNAPEVLQMIARRTSRRMWTPPANKL